MIWHFQISGSVETTCKGNLLNTRTLPLGRTRRIWKTGLFPSWTGHPRWGSGKKKNPPANAGEAGDVGSISRLEIFPGGGHGNPLLYSCLENPMDRGAWMTTVHEATKSWTPLSDWACMHTHLELQDPSSNHYWYILIISTIPYI